MSSPTAQGKVRDIYDLGDRLVLVASDRISAYDSVLPDTIPHKGHVLTSLSAFWFSKTEDIVPNHFITDNVDDIPDIGLPESYLAGRTTLVRKASVVPIECVVRGYLAGSGWQEYKVEGQVAGHKLPAGLQESDRLPEPIFTPSTKAASGHDENITVDKMRELVGDGQTDRLRSVSLDLYQFAADYAVGRGIIIADTKFEFGLIDSQMTLIDEVLTPDSSRFWPVDKYRPGSSQPSFDKQFVRDYLDSVNWNHQPPAPPLPGEVVEMTSKKYLLAYKLLTGEELAVGSRG